jgi:dTDP-4-dehydrorhamnose reductase
MRILATGTAGMLGSGLVPALVAAGHEVVASDINLADPRPFGVNGPALRHLDVRDRDAVNAAVAEVDPELVVHLAAMTGLEDCENDTDNAWATNALGTKHVALAAKKAGAAIVYISTAGVFDGTKETAYDEFDDPNPINAYGASKYEGERFIRWFSDAAYIVRAGWMVGGGVKDHKFVARMLQQIRDGRDTIHAVDDKLGTPTYVPDFSACLSRLVAKEAYGLYHMACEGEGSRFDVACAIVDSLGLADRVQVLPVSSDYFKEEFFAERPRSEIMRNRALDLQGDNTMRPWRVAIADYLALHIASDPSLASIAVPAQQRTSIPSEQKS